MLYKVFLWNKIYEVDKCGSRQYCFVDNNKHVREFDYNIQGLIACKWAIILETIKDFNYVAPSIYQPHYTATDIVTLNKLEQAIVQAKAKIDNAVHNTSNVQAKENLEMAQQEFTRASDAKKAYKLEIWARHNCNCR